MDTTTAGRTMTTRKGQRIYTELTDREAIDLTAGLAHPFLISMHQQLGQGRGLSQDQMAWTHHHAMKQRDALAAAAVEPAEGDGGHSFLGLYEHLAAARDRGLKTPGMLLLWPGHEGERVKTIRAKLMGERSRHAGRVMVCDGPGGGSQLGDRLYGYIDADGTYRTRGALTPDPVLAALTMVNDDPEGEARKYGKLTGNCCYCQASLETPESLEAGYGPVCARQRGLPWGKRPGRPEPAPTPPVADALAGSLDALAADREQDAAFAATEAEQERRGFESDPDYRAHLAREEESYRDFPGEERAFDPEALDEMAREDAEGRSFEAALAESGREATEAFYRDLAAVTRAGGYY